MTCCVSTPMQWVWTRKSWTQKVSWSAYLAFLRVAMYSKKILVAWGQQKLWLQVRNIIITHLLTWNKIYPIRTRPWEGTFARYHQKCWNWSYYKAPSQNKLTNVNFWNYAKVLISIRSDVIISWSSSNSLIH